MSLDLSTIEQERTRELILATEGADGRLDEVRFTIRYASPKLLESWRRSIVNRGIANKDMMPAQGRFADYCRSIAETFVIGWSGAIRPEGTAYSPEAMGQILQHRSDVMALVQQAIAETEAFFGRNGHAQTGN